MTINNDLFTRRPLSFEIPNDGVTKVDRPNDSKRWEVLQYELTSFVCEGEYEHGLERILSSYVSRRGSATQPAVWVSGFYGSGKSHLVRVLQHLWANTKLPSGASARGLVNLPSDVSDKLTELSTFAKRDGAEPWSVAGELEGNVSLNSSFLGFVFGAAGLPAQVEPARVALWLAGKGALDAVRAHVEAAGADFIEELSEYNLSSDLADAILAVDPGFATSAADVKNLLLNQYPTETQELTTGDTIALLRKVLEFVGDGAIPPTLIVLDEVQQYINGDGARALEVQSLAKAVSTELDGRVLLVGTGQQELTADATLQKIQDRFTVRVVLKNQDVDAVVRRVLLNKEPGQRSTLRSALDGVSGEISRQLAGSQVQHSAQDDADLVEDYPLLPSRRRFWEGVLRQADAGRAGQLRSQLRIVHDANCRVASEEVGCVVGADYLYLAKHEDLNAAGLLLKETQRLIHDEGQKQELRGRVLGLIHLISLLPTTPPGDIGVRANVDHLVDLLVEDLVNDGAALRQELPVLLAALTDEGVLQQDGDEYRLQTVAGRAWDAAFRRHSAQLTDSEISTERDTRLRAEVEAALPARVAQGNSKVARKLSLHTESAAPTSPDLIPVWLRSEWDDGTTVKQFEDLARGLGSDSPVVLVHLPRAQAQSFAAALRNELATKRTLDQQGIPQDDEGKQAQRAMETRLSRAEAQVSDHIRDIVSKASVRLGGGSSPTGAALRDRIENGAQSAATRLFSKFGDADDARWSQVIDRIRKGSGVDALRQVGYDADALQQPVVKEVLERISGAGTPASDVEKILLSAPFGWPRDAVMGAIGVLLDNGVVRATINGSDAKTDQVLSQTRLGPVNLRRESSVLKSGEKIAARSLLQGLGVTAENDTLLSSVEKALDALTSRAAAIRGEAPLPDVMLPSSVVEIKKLSGNDRVHALLAAKDDLIEVSERLAVLAKRRPTRIDTLSTARALANAAEGLDNVAEVRTRLEAFEQTRELLADNDQISPIATDLASAVRDAVTTAADTLEATRKAAVEGLATQVAWAALDGDKQSQLLNDNKLSPEAKPTLNDAEAVVKAVQARPLASWSAEVDAVPARAAKALEAAVRLTAPKAGTVRVPTATISSADDVEAYLDALRASLTVALAEYDTVVVKG